MQTQRPILFFDGVCNLCNSTIQKIIRFDKQKQFLFAPLQSTAGREALQHVTEAEGKAGSVILFHNDQYYTRSSAVLQVFRLLGGWFNLLLAGYILPRFLRDALYNYIASHRYKWFGQQNECMVPTAELKERFLA
ncbi:hypothetical protein CJD36_019460 [Flavipsychrobacter stenotrophus]|uniref:Thiol-disulfide oxidoreductase n=1 Tax=Flavipsychrobacter stenotrophus TaxID=2077091 RepID=A0A2S7SR84_9BACT|nr:DCC1-like thiol-disulfide oxidoreductase family protein [Flavipsychrobacter stenotrophus]PQJ09422.1 hypothetical protein CJD36_019460 [Flavipsychrobacter stenotrophus]